MESWLWHVACQVAPAGLKACSRRCSQTLQARCSPMRHVHSRRRHGPCCPGQTRVCPPLTRLQPWNRLCSATQLGGLRVIKRCSRDRQPRVACFEWNPPLGGAVQSLCCGPSPRSWLQGGSHRFCAERQLLTAAFTTRSVRAGTSLANPAPPPPPPLTPNQARAPQRAWSATRGIEPGSSLERRGARLPLSAALGRTCPSSCGTRARTLSAQPA